MYWYMAKRNNSLVKNRNLYEFSEILYLEKDFDPFKLWQKLILAWDAIKSAKMHKTVFCHYKIFSQFQFDHKMENSDPPSVRQNKWVEQKKLSSLINSAKKYNLTRPLLQCGFSIVFIAMHILKHHGM